nr:MAG TPA: hypothetical protein [Caudoviricetes sp.]
MKATELGKAIAMVEYINKCVHYELYKFIQIASDRWALVKIDGGKTRTIATGKDIYEVLYSWDR